MLQLPPSTYEIGQVELACSIGGRIYPKRHVRGPILDQKAIRWAPPSGDGDLLIAGIVEIDVQIKRPTLPSTEWTASQFAPHDLLCCRTRGRIPEQRRWVQESLLKANGQKDGDTWTGAPSMCYPASRITTKEAPHKQNYDHVSCG